MTSFKPAQQASTNGSAKSTIDWAAVTKKIKAGSRPARVSLIVDLGEQDREDYQEAYNPNDPKHIADIESGAATIEEGTGNDRGKQMYSKKQTPKHQVVLFADLMKDLVDYGGEIGEKPYRIMMNSSFKGEIKGTTFGAVPPTTKGGLWTFHGGSLLTKLANATDTPAMISDGPSNMDISLLLGKPFMANIVKKSTDGTKEFINFKGCASVPEIDDGVFLNVPEMDAPALCITFDNVTAETAKFLRNDVKNQIRKAHNFQGSVMQQVIGNGEEQQQTPQQPAAQKPSGLAAAYDAPDAGFDFDDSKDPF